MLGEYDKKWMQHKPKLNKNFDRKKGLHRISPPWGGFKFYLWVNLYHTCRRNLLRETNLWYGRKTLISHRASVVCIFCMHVRVRCNAQVVADKHVKAKIYNQIGFVKQYHQSPDEPSYILIELQPLAWQLT